MNSTRVDGRPTDQILLAPNSESPGGPVLSCVISARLHPEDRQALLQLFASSSPQTRRNRFHHALSVFPERYLEEILAGEQLALVARDSCHPGRYGVAIGLASAAGMNDQAAEVAVWVDDAWHRRGVGARLLQEILALLPEQGYREAVGFVEPSNEAARRLVLRVCPKAEIRFHDGILRVRIPLVSSTMPTINEKDDGNALEDQRPDGWDVRA